MKKIILFLLAIIMAFQTTACSKKVNDANNNSVGKTTDSDDLFRNDEPYQSASNKNSEIKDSKTEKADWNMASTNEIEIKGIKYRNSFTENYTLIADVGEMKLVESNKESKYYSYDSKHKSFLIKDSGNSNISSDHVYCKSSDWKKYRSYYSDVKNYSVSLTAYDTNSEEKTYHIIDADLCKINDLIAFCKANKYDEQSFAIPDNTHSVSGSVFESSQYRITVKSNDGLFIANTPKLVLYKGKISLNYYTVMSEDKTILIDLPTKLEEYFLLLLKTQNISAG